MMTTTTPNENELLLLYDKSNENMDDMNGGTIIQRTSFLLASERALCVLFSVCVLNAGGKLRLGFYPFGKWFFSRALFLGTLYNDRDGNLMLMKRFKFFP